MSLKDMDGRCMNSLTEICNGCLAKVYDGIFTYPFAFIIQP